MRWPDMGLPAADYKDFAYATMRNPYSRLWSKTDYTDFTTCHRVDPYSRLWSKADYKDFAWAMR